MKHKIKHNFGGLFSCLFHNLAQHREANDSCTVHAKNEGPRVSDAEKFLENTLGSRGNPDGVNVRQVRHEKGAAVPFHAPTSGRQPSGIGDAAHSEDEEGIEKVLHRNLEDVASNEADGLTAEHRIARMRKCRVFHRWQQ